MGQRHWALGIFFKKFRIVVEINTAAKPDYAAGWAAKSAQAGK